MNELRRDTLGIMLCSKDWRLLYLDFNLICHIATNWLDWFTKIYSATHWIQLYVGFTNNAEKKNNEY